MSVRAKFRCDSITLRHSSCTNPEVLEAIEEDRPSYATIQEQAFRLDVPTSVDFDQPTVALSPVVSGPDSSEEDRSFWEATPQGRIARPPMWRPAVSSTSSPARRPTPSG